MGCPSCLLRRLEVSGAIESYGNERPVRVGDDGLRAWGPAALRIAAELVVARILRWRLGGATQTEITLYHPRQGTTDARVLIPDSMCGLCGPGASSTLPRFEMSTAPPPGGTQSLRERALDQIELDHYVSPLGLLGMPRVDLQSPFGATSLQLPSRLRPPEPAIGRARSYDRSRSAAILEGLERYCGLHRGGARIVERAPHSAMGERAICPTSMGTHPDSSYAEAGFPYVMFSEAIEVDWVEAYSFAHQGSRWVPERAAFWGPRRDGEPSFFFETSNGCSLGNSLEEATLHGLRELIERDSFLLTWYRRLALPEIDLSRGGELVALVRRCELFTGFRFRAFWSTLGFGMSSVWIVAVDEDGTGPCVLAGGAAHPDPRRAIVGGLYELCGVVLATLHRYPSIREHGLEMLQDPTLVRRMEDHSDLSCLPEARDRFSFLLDRDEGPVDLRELAHEHAPRSIREHLEAVTGALGDQGIDVLVVDQTMPEVSGAGFCCVKVIAPGLLPMTFGHANRRTEHLPRLMDVGSLPYPSMLTADAEVGLHPHPFP